MSEPVKPFFKPFSQPSPSVSGDGSIVSKSELTTYAVAAGMPVPADRTAFLDHACAGNAVLREKIEQRLAARVSAPEPQSAPLAAPAAASGAELQRMPEPLLTTPQNQPAGMALVPMSVNQLAAITAQRQNTFPWMTAIFLAVAAGALGVFLMQEKDARQRAETAGRQAGLRADTAVQEAAAARKERETAAEQLSAARKESEQLRALADEQRQRADTAIQRQRLAGEATAKKDEGAAALVQAERERDAIRVTQKETNLVLADALARLAAAQLDGSRFGEAEISARRSLELRTAQAIGGWPLVESRTLLGAALLQKNADAEAGREFAAAASEIEQLGVPAADADRGRLNMAAKRIVQFYNATGRRKEGAELKRKFDGMARPQ
jgi:hypothetical protein